MIPFVNSTVSQTGVFDKRSRKDQRLNIPHVVRCPMLPFNPIFSGGIKFPLLSTSVMLIVNGGGQPNVSSMI